MQLLKLVESEVQIGIPLPWNVRNQQARIVNINHTKVWCERRKLIISDLWSRV